MRRNNTSLVWLATKHRRGNLRKKSYDLNCTSLIPSETIRRARSMSVVWNSSHLAFSERPLFACQYFVAPYSSFFPKLRVAPPNPPSKYKGLPNSNARLASSITPGTSPSYPFVLPPKQIRHPGSNKAVIQRRRAVNSDRRSLPKDFTQTNSRGSDISLRKRSMPSLVGITSSTPPPSCSASTAALLSDSCPVGTTLSILGFSLPSSRLDRTRLEVSSKPFAPTATLLANSAMARITPSSRQS